MKALLVSFSGPDGSGKTTQIEKLKEALEQRGLRPVVVWTRLGYTPGFEQAKTLVRRLLRKKVPQRGQTGAREKLMRRGHVRALWLAVASADLLLTHGLLVRAITSAGCSVILDRTTWDALIDRRIFYPESNWVEEVLCLGFRVVSPRPDASFMLSVPLEVSQSRSEAKAEPFPDPPEVRAARHREYQQLEAETGVIVVDATRAPDVIAAEILARLSLGRPG